MTSRRMEPVTRHRVIRIDTYGTRYEVRAGLTRAEAERVVREMEAHHHNQSYHIEEMEAGGGGYSTADERRGAGGQVVCAIIDEAWTGDLLALCGRHHVWIPGTPGNASAITRARASLTGGSCQDRGLTTYGFHGVEQALASLIADIAEHHAGDGAGVPAWSEIRVTGRHWDEGCREVIARQLPGVRWEHREHVDGFSIVR